MPFMDIRGAVRNLAGISGPTRAELQANQNGELIIAQGNPAFTEITREGLGYNVMTATLFAPLVAIPTTTAQLEIYNNNVGTALVVTDLFAAQILSTAATQTYAIYAQVTTQKAVPSLTALTMFSRSGRPSVTPTATSPVVTGVGTTVVANGWEPWGSVQAWGTAAATPGNSWSVPVDGKLIVPFGTSLCVHVVGSLATASTFQVGAGFYIQPMAAPMI